MIRVAIVGAGPAGFYAAAALEAQSRHEVAVDVFDRLPTPYGLVRGGVAPDHQKIKSVIRVYETIARHPAFRFFGNVEVGRDIGVPELLAHYDQVIYAVGNESPRRLGIPGEALERAIPATAFVGWYNGHPDFAAARFDLSVARVAIVGNGNVAIDVARILAQDPAGLAASDMPDYALEALRASRVREVVLLGRRGVVQAAFTPLELKELVGLPGTDVLVDLKELILDPVSRTELEALKATAAPRRNLAILEDAARRGSTGAARAIRFRFLVSPVEVYGDAAGAVAGVALERNRIEAGADGAARAVGTGALERLDVQALFFAIGYQQRPIDGIPFDARRGLVPNLDGRVVDPATLAPLAGQYVVGWARSGPRGLIGIHKAASAEVVERLLADAALGIATGAAPGARDAIVGLLERRGVRWIGFDGWKRIDEIEIERGTARGAPRVKLHDVEDMLDVGSGQEA